MTDRPDLPKRMASRIVSAQNKVMSAMASVLYNEINLNQDRRRLAEYMADPYGFARKHYGNNSPDSYPVQTNINRCRESIDYRTKMSMVYLDSLNKADKALADIEAEILISIANMKHSSGRVSWPCNLETVEITFSTLRKESEISSAEADDERRKQDTKLEIILLETESEYAKQCQKENKEYIAERNKRWNKMSPEAVADEKRAYATQLKRVKDGKLTIWDIIAMSKKEFKEN